MTVDELINSIYEDNYSHFDFMDNMNGGECDCTLHQCMWLIQTHAGIEVDA
jgi:hypothetical protein